MLPAIPRYIKDPAIRVSMMAIFAFGFSGATTAPYQSIVGIRELGLSDRLYSTVIFLSAAVNVTVSLLGGNLADRIGAYRRILMIVSCFGIVGYGAIYLLASAASFLFATLLLLPVFGALNSLLFANIRSVTRGLDRGEMLAVNSMARAMISLAWVLVPGLTGLMLMGSGSMLPAYLFAALGALACFALILFLLPEQRANEGAAARHLSHLAALREVVSPRIFGRIVAVALITSALHVNDAVLPLVTVEKAGGTTADIGILVGIVALLEIVFIFVWGRLQRRISPVAALSAGTAIYVVYLGLLGLSTMPWHLYALCLISGAGAAALISVPIGYLQGLIEDRPGLGSALISVNIFLSAGLSALLFGLGTSIGDYSTAATIGGLAGLTGLVALLVLERRFDRKAGR